jgi:predicted nucleotidyltransferase
VFFPTYNRINQWVLYICSVNSPKTLSTIKTIVNSFLPGSQALLFGSRATGKANADSDYDLLIITADTFSPRDKMDWENKIRKALVYALNAPFDVLLQSKGEVDEKKNLTGHIVRYAIREAIEL